MRIMSAVHARAREAPRGQGLRGGPTDQEIPSVLEIELPNMGPNVLRSGSSAEFTVLLPAPITLRPGAELVLSQAYLTLFNGAAVGGGNIIIERDYTFTVVGVPTYHDINTTAAANVGNFGRRLVACPDGTNDPTTLSVVYTIKRGSYSPAALCELFNQRGGAYAPVTMPVSTLAPQGETLPFPSMAPLAWKTGNPGPPYQDLWASANDLNGPNGAPRVQSTSKVLDFYANTTPSAVALLGAAQGLQLDFDGDRGLFRISSNFTPLISEATGGAIIILATGGAGTAQRQWIDRSGAFLVTDWGYANTDEAWAGSFWERLGFLRQDLYRENLNDPFLFGNCYANIDPLSMLALNDFGEVGTPGASPQMAALKVNQQLLISPLGADNVYNAKTYDGTTIGPFASNPAILIPTPYCRVVLDILTAGAASGVSAPNRGLVGFSQAVNLLDTSEGSITSFSIFNPCPHIASGATTVSAIRVRVEDPRDNKPLSWMGDAVASTFFLRITQ